MDDGGRANAATLLFVGYFHVVSLLVVAGQLVAMLLLEPRRWRRFVLAAAQTAIREPSAHGQDFRGAAALVATDCSAKIS